MSLTKIQPSGLDQTKSFAVDSLAANTILANGTDFATVTSTANASLVLAQGAFDAVNTNSNIITTLQDVNVGQNTTITAVNNLASASYEEANSVSTVAGVAYTQSFAANNLAQSSYHVANASFTKANSAYELAGAAFAQANTGGGGGGGTGITYTAANTAPVGPNVGDQWFKINESILFEYVSDGTVNTWIDITSASTSLSPIDTPTIIAYSFLNMGA